MGLITSRVEVVLFPLSRFGKLPPRPGFHAERMQESRQKRERRTQLDLSGQGRAHPDDSVLTPFVEWEKSREEESVRQHATAPDQEDGTDDALPDDHQLDLRKARRRERDERRAAKAMSWKEEWNRVSRGGRLGDDAEVYERQD